MSKRKALASSDPYEKRKCREIHVQFKQRMNDIFRDLLTQNVPKGQNIVYLDSLSGETTNTLKGCGYQCYIANNCKDVATQLAKDHQLTVEHGDAAEIMKTKWKNISFQAAYFDGCTSRCEYVLPFFESFFDREFDNMNTIVLGVTLTGRDNSKTSPHERLQLSKMLKIKETFHKLATRHQMEIQKNECQIDKEDCIDDGVYTEFFVLIPQKYSTQATTQKIQRSLKSTQHVLTSYFSKLNKVQHDTEDMLKEQTIEMKTLVTEQKNILQITQDLSFKQDCALENHQAMITLLQQQRQAQDNMKQQLEILQNQIQQKQHLICVSSVAPSPKTHPQPPHPKVDACLPKDQRIPGRCCFRKCTQVLSARSTACSTHEKQKHLYDERKRDAKRRQKKKLQTANLQQ